MQAKLTLSIDKNVIERAKHYAQQHQQSVSSLVEAYLDRISAQSSRAHNLQTPITEHLTGMFRAQDNGQDYKELLADARLDKHL
ncbi:DUF6364 family protein [Acinetobacter ursingii]|uniref:DUF6364 family protein n=1 Tax=Acinetobacter ursingii TaxID=108980 RepID=UPI0012502E01|nr:DUF6364 family protein [Acinetobacter ursingii]MCU4350566.1 antitoxin [Acinetobacter ursingii]MDI3237174.1 DUF6364 family protein [Acinetobacter ursingii]